MSTTLKLTTDQYEHMIARGAFDGIRQKIELIHGELREMNPAGPVHEDYIDYLNHWSFEATSGSGIVVRVQNSIFADDSLPEPDLAWLRPGRYANRRPNGNDVLLLIEVADSTLEYDRGEKLRLYAGQSIVEYWVVDVQGRCVHVHTGPVGNDYKQHHVVPDSETLSPRCQPTAKLTLSELFIA